MRKKLYACKICGRKTMRTACSRVCEREYQSTKFSPELIEHLDKLAEQAEQLLPLGGIGPKPETEQQLRKRERRIKLFRSLFAISTRS
ncbi:hypothetical protein EB077_13220, partial [bacterium]|nr:hypothetical protein [bacterium]